MWKDIRSARPVIRAEATAFLANDAAYLFWGDMLGLSAEALVGRVQQVLHSM